MKNILDLPETTVSSSKLIKRKKFLFLLYQDFYYQMKKLSRNLPQGRKLELGSGGGFLKEVIGDVITSDVIKLPICDMVIDAEKIPFAEGSLSALYMLNTFHHIKNPKQALTEFNRVLKKGGKVIMIEPYNTFWGRFVYKNFHYEGFDEKAGWKISGRGPLSDANNALAWIVFSRDRLKYEQLFPNLKIRRIFPHTPFRYLLSGGISKLSFLPGFVFTPISKLENFLNIFFSKIGMFATIVIEKV